MDAIDQDAAAGDTQEATAKDYDEDYALLFGDEAEPAPKKESRKETIVGRESGMWWVESDSEGKTRASWNDKEREERDSVHYSHSSQVCFCWTGWSCSIGELCELLNEYVASDDSIHLILSRIIKNNNPNVNKDEKGNFINARFPPFTNI